MSAPLITLSECTVHAASVQISSRDLVVHGALDWRLSLTWSAERLETALLVVQAPIGPTMVDVRRPRAKGEGLELAVAEAWDALLASVTRLRGPAAAELPSAAAIAGYVEEAAKVAQINVEHRRRAS